MRKYDEVVPAPATNQNQRRVATEAALPVGELASGGSENGYAASVAPTSGRRKVFWCDREASQPESLCARGSNYLQMEPNGKNPMKVKDYCIFFETNFGSGCRNLVVDEGSPVRFVL